MEKSGCEASELAEAQKLLRFSSRNHYEITSDINCEACILIMWLDLYKYFIKSFFAPASLQLSFSCPACVALMFSSLISSRV
jgi:hypothetical protein